MKWNLGSNNVLIYIANYANVNLKQIFISPKVFTKNKLKIIAKTSLEKLKLYIRECILTDK